MNSAHAELNLEIGKLQYSMFIIGYSTFFFLI